MNLLTQVSLYLFLSKSFILSLYILTLCIFPSNLEYKKFRLDKYLN